MEQPTKDQLIYETGIQSLNEAKYDEAIEEFKKLPSLYQNVPQKLAEAYYQLGLNEFNEENYEGAIEEFETALGYDNHPDIQNKLLEAKLELAKHQLQKNQCDEALDLLLQVKKQDPATPKIDSLIKEARWCKYLSMFGLARLKNALGLQQWQTLAMALGGGIMGLMLLACIIGMILFGPKPPNPTPTPTIAAVTNTPMPIVSVTNAPVTPTDISTPGGVPSPEAATDTPLPPKDTSTPTLIPPTSTNPPVPPSVTDTSIPVPQPVSNIQITQIGQTGMTLNWDNPVDNYTTIVLQGNGNNTELSVDTQTYTVFNLNCGVKYNFTLFTVNSAGQSKPVSISAETDSCPPPVPPTVLTPTGKIAVPVFNTKLNTYDLYIASAPSWQPILFQNAASQPAFSPPGDQIIFRSWGGGQNLTPYAEQLVIRSLNSQTAQLATTNTEDAHPDWSNFNRPVVLHTCPNWNCQIYLLGLWGQPGDPEREMHMTDGKNPTWLPDGRIVYSSEYPNGKGMYVINQDKSGIRKIWDNNTLVAPKGSPVSNEVVFSLNDDLYLMTITNGTSQPKPLLQTPGQRERLPIWSPDGSMIAYVKDQGDEKWAVYIIRTDGSDEIKLFDLPGSINGHPSNAQISFGWEEEQLSWVQ